jgi:hypothetical protein
MESARSVLHTCIRLCRSEFTLTERPAQHSVMLTDLESRRGEESSSSVFGFRDSSLLSLLKERKCLELPRLRRYLGTLEVRPRSTSVLHPVRLCFGCCKCQSKQVLARLQLLIICNQQLQFIEKGRFYRQIGKQLIASKSLGI